MERVQKVFTEKCVNNLNADGQLYSFDPMTIISLLTLLIPIIQNCLKTPQQLKAAASKPTLLQRIALRQQVDNILRREHYPFSPVRLSQAIIETGQELSVTEVAELLADA